MHEARWAALLQGIAMLEFYRMTGMQKTPKTFSHQGTIENFWIFFCFILRPERGKTCQTCFQRSWSWAVTPSASSAVKMFPRPRPFPRWRPPRSGRRGEDGLSSVKEERGINQSGRAANAITRESVWGRVWDGNASCWRAGCQFSGWITNSEGEHEYHAVNCVFSFHICWSTQLWRLGLSLEKSSGA